MEQLGNNSSALKGVIPADLMKSYREVLENEIGFVAESKTMKEVKENIRGIGSNRRPLSVVGPTGSGRTTVAKMFHLSSADWWRPFIETDLTGWDETNSMKFLLGHREERLFTAGNVRPGLFSNASKSTLCLRNFDMYSKRVQKAIVTAFAAKEFSPMAVKEKNSLDCRMIFTLKSDPESLEKAGYIDKETMELLSEKVVILPPLAKRREDIVPLVENFIKQCARDFNHAPKRLSKEAEKWLKKAPWNENVNQLKRNICHACMNTEDAELLPKHFALVHDGNFKNYQDQQFEELSIQAVIEKKLEMFLGRLGSFEATHLYEAIMDRVEEPLLRLVLNYSEGNQIKASRVLGINRNTLRAKISKYKIKISKEGKVK